MTEAIGTRVGAILKATDDTVWLLGYGVYDGHHEPPFGPYGTTKEEWDKEVLVMKANGELSEDFCWKNPRITLDDGSIVWGAECWWGLEEKIKEMIGSRKIINAKIERPTGRNNE